jgi:hypothetical protein
MQALSSKQPSQSLQHTFFMYNAPTTTNAQINNTKIGNIMASQGTPDVALSLLL